MISHEVDHVRSFIQGEGRRPKMLALEIEWNNKDPFFDRDLENFKRLHAEGRHFRRHCRHARRQLAAELRDLVRKWVDQNAIAGYDALEALGVTPTRRQKQEVLKRTGRERNPISFRDAWTDHFVSDKFGVATTHWSKLADRVQRGVGNPCPLLLIGLPSSIVTFGEDPKTVAALIKEGAGRSSSRRISGGSRRMSERWLRFERSVNDGQAPKQLIPHLLLKIV